MVASVIHKNTTRHVLPFFPRDTHLICLAICIYHCLEGPSKRNKNIFVSLQPIASSPPQNVNTAQPYLFISARYFIGRFTNHTTVNKPRQERKKIQAPPNLPPLALCTSCISTIHKQTVRSDIAKRVFALLEDFLLFENSKHDFKILSKIKSLIKCKCHVWAKNR